MSSRELQLVERGRAHRRQNNRAPCPRGDGTTIGTFQEFTVLCNTNLEGDVLDILDAFDFTACVDLCSSFHPKCEGTSFDGAQCTLRARLQPDGQRPSRRSESAIGAFPGASSNCPTLGGAQTALGTNFTTLCGFIIAGNDISQNFAPTFQDCLGQCAATSGCAAVSFDPSQELGFKNCYLKTAPANPSDVAADRRTDSAMVAAAAGAAGSAVPAAPGPGVSTIPLGSTPAAGSGAVFFTPPGGSATGGAASGLVPEPDPSAPVATESTTSSLVMGSIPLPLPTMSTTTALFPAESVPDVAAGQDAGDNPPSMAWVAAPVVGSVAAIALIAVSFVMLRRRRRGSGSGSGEKVSTSSSRSSSSSHWAGMFTAWLPAAWTSPPDDRLRGRGRGRKMTGMGNFSEVESRRRSVEARAGVRNSVVGFMTGRPMGMERLEDVEEAAVRSGSRGGVGREKEGSGGEGGRAAGLRNSFNGLGQNKWSQ